MIYIFFKNANKKEAVPKIKNKQKQMNLIDYNKHGDRTLHK